MSHAEQPIGVFDSGIGGISVLQALRQAMPNERFVYLADSAHAPYGEKTDAQVQARSLTIAQHLVDQHGIKALVVACNTATAAAVHSLRAQHPALIVVGVEPALKPAAQATQSGRIAVMATRSTVHSEKFTRLLASLQGQAEYAVCACDGLALAIERSTRCTDWDGAEAHIQALLVQYTATLAPWGRAPGQADTLVLGCTHYVFVQEALQALVGPEVRFIDTGEPVAAQTRRRLHEAQTLRAMGTSPASDWVELLTTGELTSLQAAAQRWLALPATACRQADAL